MFPFFWPMDRDPLIRRILIKDARFNQFCTVTKRKVANQQRTIVQIQFVRRLLGVKKLFVLMIFGYLGKFHQLIDGFQHHSISIATITEVVLMCPCIQKRMFCIAGWRSIHSHAIQHNIGLALFSWRYTKQHRSRHHYLPCCLDIKYQD